MQLQQNELISWACEVTSGHSQQNIPHKNAGYDFLMCLKAGKMDGLKSVPHPTNGYMTENILNMIIKLAIHHTCKSLHLEKQVNAQSDLGYS